MSAYANPRSSIEHELPAARRVLAVCAHPDDESFGLGAVLSAYVETGAEVSVLCFTHGEASTLHAVPGQLTDVRARELAAAAGVLGVARTELLDYPDGALAEESLEELAGHVRRVARDVRADLFVVFDEGGITGHPDHRHATQAALTAAADDDQTVLAWAVPEQIARALNDEFGTGFVGRPPAQIDITVPASRRRQHDAMTRHASQLLDDQIPLRRLALTGATEFLRYLRRPSSTGLLPHPVSGHGGCRGR